ncbi:MAG: DNA-protecting protein DprA, partial [Marivivens sp.]|nr:DNA-protecting protein DprA [Marivivens sp.]
APAPAPPAPRAMRPLREIADLHRKILDRLGPSPVAEDQLARDLGARADRLAPALTDLEIEGRVTRETGGTVRRAD